MYKNEFQKREDIGRKELLDYINPNDDNSNVYDLYYSHKDKGYADGMILLKNGKCILFELKKRNYKSTDWNGIFYLETYKYTNLINYMNKYSLDDIWYINIFNDNVCAVWNIQVMQSSPTENKLCNQYTAINSNKVQKEMIKLDINKAMIKQLNK